MALPIIANACDGHNPTRLQSKVHLDNISGLKKARLRYFLGAITYSPHISISIWSHLQHLTVRKDTRKCRYEASKGLFFSLEAFVFIFLFKAVHLWSKGAADVGRLDSLPQTLHGKD